MIIDIYAHHISSRVGKILNQKKYYGDRPDQEWPFPAQNSDAEIRLALMDKYGIDVHALSQTAPVLLGFNAVEAEEICRLSNDDNYALCKAYPKRFVNICLVSLLDVNGAIKELERSVNELDCRGITLATNQDGRGLDSPEYFPFYEKLAKYDLPLFLQPTNWEGYSLVDHDHGLKIMRVFGWAFDTTQAVWRLIYGGVLDRFPTLKLVTHHCGALLPYFVRRAEITAAAKQELKSRIKKNLPDYWQNVYGDSVVAGPVEALECGYKFLGPERMMYGSDYPFSAEAGEAAVRGRLELVRSLKIPPENLNKILGENARALLRIK